MLAYLCIGRVHALKNVSTNPHMTVSRCRTVEIGSNWTVLRSKRAALSAITCLSTLLPLLQTQ
ncbi:hypothetical protein J6590_012742 [Homalodisca vitripennis]|nr:hypothetical protein J6590_012742 [Homalodisca vitripennis]